MYFVERSNNDFMLRKILFPKRDSFSVAEVEQVYHKTLFVRAGRSEPLGERSRTAG
jgi:hypothetical protein